MKWQGRRGSRNIEDRRQTSGRRRVGKTAGVGGVGLLVILVVGALMGVDVSQSAGYHRRQCNPVQWGVKSRPRTSRPVNSSRWFWLIPRKSGPIFSSAKLAVLIHRSNWCCSKARPSRPVVGPMARPVRFIVRGDKKVYLDTGFFTTMSRQLGAKGDFAAAYVVAHEVAHHVQDELGILGKANSLRRQLSTERSNQISVRIELQADCYSGIWARHAKARFGSLERG